MIRVQVKGKRYRFKTIADAARAFGLPSIPVRARVRLGWKLSKAISMPLRAHKPHAYKPSKDALIYKANKATPISQLVH